MKRNSISEENKKYYITGIFHKISQVIESFLPISWPNLYKNIQTFIVKLGSSWWIFPSLLLISWRLFRHNMNGIWATLILPLWCLVWLKKGMWHKKGMNSFTQSIIISISSKISILSKIREFEKLESSFQARCYWLPKRAK